MEVKLAPHLSYAFHIEAQSIKGDVKHPLLILTVLQAERQMIFISIEKRWNHLLFTNSLLANVLWREHRWKFYAIQRKPAHEVRFDSGSWHSKQSLRITTIILDTSTRLLTSFSKHHKIYLEINILVGMQHRLLERTRCGKPGTSFYFYLSLV